MPSSSMPVNPQPGSSTAELTGVALEERLKSHLARDPGFSIASIDRLNWICPYTLSVVPAPFDVPTTAILYLAERQPWKHGKPKPLQEIYKARWLHWLKDKWEHELRLRYLHPDGRWLNPFTGHFEDAVRYDPKRPLREHLDLLADFLARTMPQHHGRMLELYDLDDEMRRQREGLMAKDLPLMPANPTERSGLNPGTQRVVQPANPTASMATTAYLRSDLKAARTQTGAAEAVVSDRARQVMDRMLPTPPTLSGYEIGLAYQPCAGIGGDFYDFIDLRDGRWLVFMGDVAGQGTEAALLVSSTLKALRLLAPQYRSDLVGLLADLNDNIKPDLPDARTISIFAAMLDTNLSQITCCSAGHHQALLASMYRNETLRLLGKRGAPLGMFTGAQVRDSWKPETVTLNEGDCLLQCTDGLFEVNNQAGMRFGRMRSMGSFIANLEFPPRTLVERMIKEVHRFAADGKPQDDLTLLVIGLKPQE